MQAQETPTMVEISMDEDKQRVAAVIVRYMRHEIGDLLQSVYSAVALLDSSLPRELKAERTILASLRQRSTNCKQFMDAVHDLLQPMALNCVSMELSEAAARLAAAAAAAYPHLQIHVESSDASRVVADRNRIMLAGKFLIEQACVAAREQVWIQTEAGDAEEEYRWTVVDDGPSVPEDQLASLFSPLGTTRGGNSGIWLAYVQKVVRQHGGQTTASNAAEGGLCVRVVLPRTQPTAAAQLLPDNVEEER